MDFANWYHNACVCHMMEYTGTPIPEEMMAWAERSVERYREQELEEKQKSPMMAVVVAMGIYYGIRPLLERAFVAFPRTFTHENVEHTARSLVLSEAMRKYNQESILLRMQLHMITGKRYQFGRHTVLVEFTYMGATAALWDKQAINAKFISTETDPCRSQDPT